LYSIEEALRAVGDALQPLPGAKVIVLVGHGFGRVSFGRGLAFERVEMENNYQETRRALQAARTSVFCLDVTEADYHSLEAGLQLVAADTGGFFERTHLFTRQAMDRLAGALAGHYVLFVETADVKPGIRRIEVELTRRSGRVFAKKTFEG
ncbi:MAG: hypothetical protein ACRD1T_20345, partial [Acidimicrobiia bacterium]